jgi:hypothetical protein
MQLDPLLISSIPDQALIKLEVYFRLRDDSEARRTAIEEASICPTGRLVLWNKETGKPFEKEFEPSLVR